MAKTRLTGGAVPGRRRKAAASAAATGARTRLTSTALPGARRLELGGSAEAPANISGRVVDILTLHPMNRGLPGGVTYE